MICIVIISTNFWLISCSAGCLDQPTEALHIHNKPRGGGGGQLTVYYTKIQHSSVAVAVGEDLWKDERRRIFKGFTL